MNKTLKLFIFGSIPVSSMFGCEEKPHEDTRPNVLVIVLDDAGYMSSSLDILPTSVARLQSGYSPRHAK